MADGPSTYGTGRSADVAPASRVQSGGKAAETSSSLSGISHVADIAPALREQAGKVADKSLSSGVEVAQAVGKAAESAAQVLDDALPMLAGYVRNAAQYTDKFADSLRDKKAEELLSTAVTWSRQQPLLTLAGAAVLGFALSRIAKSALPAATEAASSVVDYAKEASAGTNASAGTKHENSGEAKPAHTMSAVGSGSTLGGGNAG